MKIFLENQPDESAIQLAEIIGQNDLPKEWRTSRDLSLDIIIGQIDKGVSTHHSLNNLHEHMSFVSQIEPKYINEALNNEN